MKTGTVLLLLKWTSGFAVATVVIWGITSVFTENIVPELWSDAVGRNVPAAGWNRLGRKEGWAETRIGELGIAGNVTGDKEAPKVVIWGDSFVEAYHVPDEAKMQTRLNAILEASGRPSLHAVAVGESWWSVADYVFRIPDYETSLKPVALHVIHLHTLEDTFPDQYPGARVCLFLSEPGLHLRKFDNENHELEPPKQPGGLESRIYGARLQFFLHLRTKLGRIAKLEGLRFAPGTAGRADEAPAAHRDWDRFLDPSWGASPAPVEAWRFLLGKLKAATNAPILFVYAPPTPALQGGRIVIENPERNLALGFSELCKEEGMGFVSLEEPFRLFLDESGRFPNGFHNSRPWEGHYNPEGHRIVAEVINSWIEENRHVVYPD